MICLLWRILVDCRVGPPLMEPAQIEHIEYLQVHLSQRDFLTLFSVTFALASPNLLLNILRDTMLRLVEYNLRLHWPSIS